MKDRFLSKVELIPFSECHYWTGARISTGYGQFSVNNKVQKAHRVSYELFNGPVPKDMCVLHTCDNPSCVNPKHLVLGSQLNNIKDMVQKNRQSMGSHRPFAKLTEKDVLEIRDMSKTHTRKEIQDMFSVSKQTIADIIRRKAWTYI